jgi:hypothetical protein
LKTRSRKKGWITGNRRPTKLIFISGGGRDTGHKVSFEFDLPQSAPKFSFGRFLEVGSQALQKTLAAPVFIVQNESCLL